jgi:hypothetical protein
MFRCSWRFYRSQLITNIGTQMPPLMVLAFCHPKIWPAVLTLPCCELKTLHTLRQQTPCSNKTHLLIAMQNIHFIFVPVNYNIHVQVSNDPAFISRWIFLSALHFDVGVFSFLQEWTAYVLLKGSITCSGWESLTFFVSEVNGVGLKAKFFHASVFWITHGSI